MIDNEDFLQYAATASEFEPPLPDGLEVEISEAVKETFLTEFGASPLDSVEAMQNAVTVLYRDRVERGLEFEAVLDLLPPPEIFGCSE